MTVYLHAILLSVSPLDALEEAELDAALEEAALELLELEDALEDAELDAALEEAVLELLEPEDALEDAELDTISDELAASDAAEEDAGTEEAVDEDSAGFSSGFCDGAGISCAGGDAGASGSPPPPQDVNRTPAISIAAAALANESNGLFLFRIAVSSFPQF